MAITAKKITSTIVLNGVSPSSKALPVIANDVNPIIDDVNYLDTKIVHKQPTTAAINSTATATAAQVATGYITSTSGAATTITLPTGTLLGSYIGAAQGTKLDLIIDNTAGSNTVTIAVAVNGILSAGAAAVSASFGLLTVPSGVTGIGKYTLIFSSATAYVLTRVA